MAAGKTQVEHRKLTKSLVAFVAGWRDRLQKLADLPPRAVNSLETVGANDLIDNQAAHKRPAGNPGNRGLEGL